MRKIELILDDESARRLDEVSTRIGEGPSGAIRALLGTWDSRVPSEEALDEFESGREGELRRQLADSERSFREGTSVDWDDLKNKLDL